MGYKTRKQHMDVTEEIDYTVDKECGADVDVKTNARW